MALNIVTGSGGDFGIRGASHDVYGGGLVGLAKAIRNEYPELKLKIVDCDPTAFDARCVTQELAADDAEFQVGILAGRRQALRPAQQSASQLAAGATPQAGDTWVVTGGPAA